MSVERHHCGGAAVHRQQALVLINANDATSKDVVALAHHVRQKWVKNLMSWLEPEVRFIGQFGEVKTLWRALHERYYRSPDADLTACRRRVSCRRAVGVSGWE